MALKNLRTPDQPIEITQTVLMLFGQPGIGKTSTGFTAKNPILFDFDKGAHRSQYRKTDVAVESWGDVCNVEQKDLEEFDTVIFDTVGSMIEYMTIAMIADNPKMGTNAGAPSMQGWGKLKKDFNTYLNMLRNWGKDIVLIAHDAESKTDDGGIVSRPDIPGGSYKICTQASDSIGYMHKVGNRSVIEFAQTEAWIAKCPKDYGALEVPHFGKEPDFLAVVLDEIKSEMGAISNEGQQVAAEVSDWRERIESEIDSADKINEFIGFSQNIEHKAVQAQVKALIKARAKEIDCSWDAKGKCYVANAA